MDVLLWVGWACTLVVAFFVCLIGLFGSLAMKSPLWDYEFQALAQIEWERRDLTGRNLSTSEILHMQRMTGLKETPGEPDDEFQTRALDTVQVLTGLEDRTALEEFLNKNREELLLSALTAVFRSVQNIANLNLASRVWAARRWMGLLFVIYRGLIWFLPLCFNRIGRVIERYMMIATILGITGGLLYWGFGDGLRNPSGGGIVWVNFVGVVVTIGTVIALILAVGQQFLKVVSAVSGPIRTWTKQRTIGMTFVLVVTISMLTLLQTGLWESWQIDLSRFITEQLSQTPVGDWIAKYLLFAGIIWLIQRGLSRARVRWLKIGDRITALGAAIALIFVGFVFALFAFDAPREVAQPAIFASGLALAALGAISAVVMVVEWIGKYRTLRSAGIEVRQGWFRWWALWAWSGSSVAVYIVSSMLQLRYAALVNSPVYVFVTLTSSLLVLILSILFWTGVVAVIRFALRVNKAHEQRAFHLARSSFDSTLEANQTSRG